MAIDLTVEPALRDLRRRTAEFVRDTVVPAELPMLVLVLVLVLAMPAGLATLALDPRTDR